jgi:hypothetical protein
MLFARARFRWALPVNDPRYSLSFFEPLNGPRFDDGPESCLAIATLKLIAIFERGGRKARVLMAFITLDRRLLARRRTAIHRREPDPIFSLIRSSANWSDYCFTCIAVQLAVKRD